MLFLRTAALFLFALTLTASAVGQTVVESLGFLPGGSTSAAFDVTADGRFAIGHSGSATSAGRACRFGPGGPLDLGVLPGADRSIAFGLSDGGDVACGISFGGTVSPERPFRWTASSGGALPLDPPVSYAALHAEAMSGDGQVAIGSVTPDFMGGAQFAVRWVGGGLLQALPSPPSASWTAAGAISADGSVIVGGAGAPSGFGSDAVRWESGLVERLDPAPGVVFAVANAVTRDGETIVGTADVTGFGDDRPFRWTRATGMVVVGTDLPPGYAAAGARDVSDDGSILVGVLVDAASPGQDRGFRWTDSGGYEVLPPLAGHDESMAEAVSADGSVIVGRSRTVGAGDVEAVRWVGGRSVIGQAQGTAVPNSTGAAAGISALGSTEIADADFALTAASLPPRVFGMFLVSQSLGSTPNLGGGDGTLLLGGTLGRFSAPGQIQNSGPGGRIGLEVDLGQLPQAGVPVGAAPGDTWHFQAWFRDTNPAATSNLTNAVSVTFQ